MSYLPLVSRYMSVGHELPTLGQSVHVCYDMSYLPLVSRYMSVGHELPTFGQSVHVCYGLSRHVPQGLSTETPLLSFIWTLELGWPFDCGITDDQPIHITLKMHTHHCDNYLCKYTIVKYKHFLLSF